MSALAFADPVISQRIAEWTAPPFDAATRAEVEALVSAGNGKELEDRFYRTLEFGTGGLRGKMGAGTNRMNGTIVGWATQGLANYVSANAAMVGPLRAAITHDCRHGSRLFAERAAAVLAANGFIVHISSELRPTPWLSFVVRELGCHTGIVVTASHNPKEYNGYKVYWDDGSQVVPPHDKGIIAEVDKIASDAQVKTMSFADGVARGQIKIIGDEMDTAYLKAIKRERMDGERVKRSKLRMVYTPLHGAGGTMAIRALRDWGFREAFPVEEQMKVDGDFPTSASPNPEEGKALERAIELAKRVEAHLVLATDPDADRLGIAVNHNGVYRLMTGNQLCPLITEWVLAEGRRVGKLPTNPGVVTTIVTTALFGAVARKHGAGFAEVLTGFKWIAQQIREWESTGGPSFVYGAEESYGFMIGTHARDKDGIVASCVVAEMAAAAMEKGRTLYDELFELYAEHGPRHEWQKNVTMPGKDGAEKIQGILNRIRTNPPKEVGGVPVTRYINVDARVVLDGQTGAKIEDLKLPSSPVFIFELANGSKAVARPSGTEPKIKFYLFLADQPIPGMTAVQASARVDELEKEAPAFEAAFLRAIGYEG